MSPRVSVVVPIYNVAAYLEPCLESIARQSHKDIEVIVVDDGSTDESPSIAAGFVERDPRFRLVHQENAGLGAARNTGIDHASGQFLAFVDGDDLVPPRAYDCLVGALLRTGSDFASGNVHRLTPFRTVRGSFLGQTFDRTRLRTHVTRFPRLLLDRTAWNKLFRRSFWDEHALRFPEGVFYEDTPVTLPAHFMADSVDVLEDVVYLWRLREGSELSITDRRTDVKALRDRVAAVDYVSRFLADRGLKFSKLLYDRNVLSQDLAYFMAVLPAAGDEFRATFVEIANDFLERADSFAFDQPLAINRLKWELVRKRALPELLEVLRFEREDLAETPPVRAGRRWFGDYPFRDDPRLDLKSSVYELDDEFATLAGVEQIEIDDRALRISGYAYIDLIGAPEGGSQRVKLVARRRGWPPAKVSFETEGFFRPDLALQSVQQLVSLDFAGFTAELMTSELGRRDGTWDISAVVRAEGRVRRNRRWKRAPLRAVAPVQRRIEDGRLLRLELTSSGSLTLRVTRARSVVRAWTVDEDVLQLEGELQGIGPGRVRLLLSGGSGTTHPVHVHRADKETTFLARVPLTELRERSVDLQFLCGETLVPLELPLEATSVLEGSQGPTVRKAEWTPQGILLLSGSWAGCTGEHELFVAALGRPQQHVVGFLRASGEDMFEAQLDPVAVRSFAGEHPLAQGTWELLIGPPAPDGGAITRPRFGHDLLAELPLTTTVGLKRFHLGISNADTPVVAVERDLDDDERGGLRQRELRRSFYPDRRVRALREAVLYDCFGGSEYSDSPRAIHEELVRRGAEVEHLWIVKDASFTVPSTATAVREGGREYYEAYATSRYIVANDHWAKWFSRRSDQICIQTWHGAPLKFQGLELERRPHAVREYRRALGQHPGNWQYVLSPGSFATATIERAFPVEGTIVESGIPRTDIMLAPDRERVTEVVRARLGLGDERVVLYAPTYRDNLDYSLGQGVPGFRDRPTFQSEFDYREGYRLGETLDVAALSAALGDGHVILFRKHPRVADRMPPEFASAALDVSWYPDGLELLLVADVLVTDYSSWIFDFAVTGRPMVFFAPDLEAYRDEIRGLHVDLQDEAPGPLARTTAEVIEAVQGVADVQARFRERYEAFVATYCKLADGRASSRVVERVFGS
jgi:CDP-glycerol glycerophosphotransferase